MNDSVIKWNKDNFQGVKSLGKSTLVLKALSQDIRKLSEIARRSELSKSTTHRFLRSLISVGLATQDPSTEEYYLGPLIYELASNPLQAHRNLIYYTYQKLEDLRDFTNETTSLDIKLGMEKYNLQQFPSLNNIAYIARPAGNVDYLWSGAIGKALMAQLSENELNIVLENIKLKPLTPNTIVDKKIFKKEIDKVRELGYATSFGETDVSVIAIAAPIKNYMVPASVAIIGLQNRLAPKVMGFINELTTMANEISQALSDTKKS